jgi:hypothetical protein
MRQLLFFVFVFLVLNAGRVFAQNGFTPFFEVGVKSSANIATAYISDDPEGSNFIGPVVGVRYLHMQTKNMGFLAEVDYNRLSFSSEGTDYSYSFIHTPFMTRVRFPLGQKHDIGLNIGSYLQMILDHHDDVVFDRRTLFGLAGGIDYGFLIGKMRLSVEGRYHYNLYSNSEDADNMRSSWLEVGLSVSFRQFRKQ